MGLMGMRGSIRGRDEERWSLRYPKSLVGIRLWVREQHGSCGPQTGVVQRLMGGWSPCMLLLEAMLHGWVFGPTLKKWCLPKKMYSDITNLCS